MEFSSFFFHFFFFGLLFQLSSANVISIEAEITAEVAPTDKSISLIERIPSFNSLVRTFNKSYPTDVDRMGYYSVRAPQTFQSVIRYKKHNSTSYLKINEMSCDWSPAELKQLHMSRDTYEKERPAAIELADIDDHDDGDEKGEDEKYYDIGDRQMQQRIKRDIEDVVYIDHRESGCLSELRDQGNCGSCYIFATIALYEWVNCKKTGVFQAFSEQYVIDCGYRYGNNGCNGGNPSGVADFVANCGLMLRENYPYTGEQGDCPYDDSFPSEMMGYLRVKEAGLMHVELESLAEHLEYGPLIVIINVSCAFDAYPGGVDDNEGHDPNDMHTMLLIGHGRENGKEYWLLRNSYGPTWAEDGHYKLNKNANCFRGGFGLASAAIYMDRNSMFPEFVKGINPYYDSEAVSDRQRRDELDSDDLLCDESDINFYCDESHIDLLKDGSD